MRFDSPNGIATTVMQLSMSKGTQQVSPLAEPPKGARSGFQCLILFLVLFTLNIFWPYG